MQILHVDLRSVDDGYADLRYGWENLNAFEARRLPLAEIQDLIDEMERDYYVSRPEDYVQTGKRLYAWLDGCDRWLAQLLESARAGVVLAIATTERLSHLPWEVLHDGTDFLVARPFPVVVPVRWTGTALSWRQDAVPNRPLQALFMATSPEGVTPVLDFEVEEGRILAATQAQPLTLTVEESGCLDGLKNLLASYGRGHFDVVHLTGHATVTAEGPLFITESETGARVDAAPQEIAKTLQFRFPVLMFLSGCRTGQRGRGGEVPSMAGALLELGAGAVLGWGRPVLDTDGILAAETLYAVLAEAMTLPEALAMTYQAMIAAKARDWHLLRLYVRGELPQNLVTPKNTRGRALSERASMATEFLDAQENVKVPTRESFVGRRRPLQNCLRALQEPEVPGVLLYGMGGLGKSSLAARICDRLDGFERVVWFGGLDEAGLVNRLGDYVGREARQRLQDPQEDLKYRLRDLFAVDGGPVFLLVLDDFEANLAGEPFRLTAGAAAVLGALLWALAAARRGHKVLMTCRYNFEFSGMAGFYKQPLAGLKAADLQKKCAQLKTFERGSGVEETLRERALELADGNPRLLEWLDRVMQAQAVDLAGLLNALESERRVELRAQVMAQMLLEQIDTPMKEMLSRAYVYELSVPKAAILNICEDIVDRETLIERSISLGLLEESPNSTLRVPRIIPIELRKGEELLNKASKALLNAWRENCEKQPESHFLEIHRLALGGKEKDIALATSVFLSQKWLSKQGRFRETIEICEKTLPVVNDITLISRIASAKRALGLVDEAYILYEETIRRLESDKRKSYLYDRELEIRGCLADLDIQKGNLKKALLESQTCLEIADNLEGTQANRSRAISHRRLGAIHSELGEHQEALREYNTSLELLDKSSDSTEKGIIIHEMAMLHFASGEIGLAEEAYMKALDYHSAGDNLMAIRSTLYELGRVLSHRGKFSFALDIFEKYLSTTQETGKLGSEAKVRYEIGHIFLQQNKLKKATEMLEKTLEIERKLGSTADQIMTLNHLSEVYLRRKFLKKSKKYLDKSITLTEQLVGKPAIKADTYCIVARRHFLAGNAELALDNLELGLQYFRESDSWYLYSQTLIMIANVQLNHFGDHKLALKYLYEALSTLEKIDDAPDSESVGKTEVKKQIQILESKIK